VFACDVGVAGRRERVWAELLDRIRSVGSTSCARSVRPCCRCSSKPSDRVYREVEDLADDLGMPED
jgi:hypothetical protein